jgi:hypothetical protein
MRTQLSDSIHDLIHSLKGGVDFYQQAREQVGNAHLSEQYLAMIQVREKALKKLAPYVKQDESKDTCSDFLLELHRAYSGVKVSLRSDPRRVYRRQSRWVERETLKALNKVINLASERELRHLFITMRIEIVEPFNNPEILIGNVA